MTVVGAGVACIIQGVLNIPYSNIPIRNTMPVQVFPGAGASGVPSGNFTARYQDRNGQFIEATKQLIDTALANKGQAGYVPTMATGLCSDSGMAGWYARDVTTNEVQLVIPQHPM